MHWQLRKGKVEASHGVPKRGTKKHTQSASASASAIAIDGALQSPKTALLHSFPRCCRAGAGDWALPVPAPDALMLSCPDTSIAPAHRRSQRPALSHSYPVPAAGFRVSTLNRPFASAAVAHTRTGALNLFRTWSCKGGVKLRQWPVAALCSRNRLKSVCRFPTTLRRAATTDYYSYLTLLNFSIDVLPHVLPHQSTLHPPSLPLSSHLCAAVSRATWRASVRAFGNGVQF